MEQYVGLDVSLKETSLCVVDQTGTTLWQGKCASTPECIAAVLTRRAPGATRIGLESGLLSTWHWHALKALGLPVVCLDARHVKAALSLRLNKTDANDAEGLAQIVRTGWYRQVQVKSLDSHLIRTLLGARAGLVAMHRDVANQIAAPQDLWLGAGEGGGRSVRSPCPPTDRRQSAPGRGDRGLAQGLADNRRAARHPAPARVAAHPDRRDLSPPDDRAGGWRRDGRCFPGDRG